MTIKVRGEDGSGLDRLVALMRHGKRSVWEAVMATVVNLSHLDRFRPTLGNAGAIVALISALERSGGEGGGAADELTPKEVAHSSLPSRGRAAKAAKAAPAPIS